MSSASVRARLEAATPGPWVQVGATTMGAATLRTGEQTGLLLRGAPWSIDHDANFIAHARTDLELALDVIEAAKAMAATGMRKGTITGRLADALDRWEAGT